MGIIRFFKKKTNERQSKDECHELFSKCAYATAQHIDIDFRNQNEIKNCFIAFDVETTGLNPAHDRIIEIGAVKFMNGAVDKVFSTLVNPGIIIKESASDVNKITNKMLSKAPCEKVVYRKFVDFLGDALDGKIVMCAHNAKFDFDFLCNTLSRLGFDANIEYIDTLRMSRRYLSGLENYKQATIEEHFGLKNKSAHRAAYDAEICGLILLRLMEIANDDISAEKEQMEKVKLNQQELEVCAYIQDIIARCGGDVKTLRYKKNSSGYVDVCCLYKVLRFKFTKKGNYILIKSDCNSADGYHVEKCTQSEGGLEYVRVYFSTPFDLEPLSEYIYKEFLHCYTSMNDYSVYSRHGKQEIEKINKLMYSLKDEDVVSLLDSATRSEYTPISIERNPTPSRDDVVINAIHSRVPIDEICNIDDWDKGFDEGYKYWVVGEEARKKGNIDYAIDLFNHARKNGYLAPVLYNSYAMAYRQLKDYSNEILILDEGIERIPTQRAIWETRREKAISLLYAQQERNEEEKNKLKAEKKSKTMTSIPDSKVRGRAIIQMDDNDNIIKEYPTITAASQEVGVNSKSIRDAANGVQKHAGGYRWKYK